MKIFICALGSLGDLNPFLRVGGELQKRGHDVTIISSGGLQDHIKHTGLNFFSAFSKEQYTKWRTLPTDTAYGHEDVKSFLYLALPAALNTGRFILDNYVPNETIVLGMRCQSIGVQLAANKINIKSIEVELAPRKFDIDTNAKLGFNTNFDKYLAVICKSFGVSGSKRDWYDWCGIFDYRIAFYPDWFATADVLKDTAPVPMDFVFHPDDDEMPLPSILLEFIEAGEPPIGFTFGSYVSSRNDLFYSCAQACEKIGKRAIFLTKYADQLPTPLPKNVLHIDYVSLKKLLPKLCLLVHHGGIGTIAQTFRAGIPQLVCPMAYDQFENAKRVTNLNVGLSIEMRDITTETLADKIMHILNKKNYQLVAQFIAKNFFSEEDGVAKICNEIERLAKL